LDTVLNKDGYLYYSTIVNKNPGLRGGINISLLESNSYKKRLAGLLHKLKYLYFPLYVFSANVLLVENRSN
jgi:hypothetical protein